MTFPSIIAPAVTFVSSPLSSVLSSCWFLFVSSEVCAVSNLSLYCLSLFVPGLIDTKHKTTATIITKIK